MHEAGPEALVKAIVIGVACEALFEEGPPEKSNLSCGILSGSSRNVGIGALLRHERFSIERVWTESGVTRHGERWHTP